MQFKLRSVLHLLLASVALAAAAPVGLSWNTPATCVRELSTYNVKQCTTDLGHLIRMARQSIKDIELVGKSLADVVGSGAHVLPNRLPTRHTCYPRRIRKQDPSTMAGWQWADDDFVPYRLNLECDDHEVITALSWH